MKKITNYHELAVEKQRLHQKLALLKRDVDSEIHEIKLRFRPITRIVELVTGGGSDEGADEKKESLLKTGLKAGAALGVDFLVGRKLRNAGMLTKLLVSPILSGISSKILSKFRKKK